MTCARLATDSWLGRRKGHRIVILGLDAVGKCCAGCLLLPFFGLNECVCVQLGKTTILYYFAHGDVVSAVPTVGFNAEGRTVSFPAVCGCLWVDNRVSWVVAQALSTTES